jgi:hypothetical protein
MNAGADNINAHFCSMLYMYHDARWQRKGSLPILLQSTNVPAVDAGGTHFQSPYERRRAGLARRDLPQGPHKDLGA